MVSDTQRKLHSIAPLQGWRPLALRPPPLVSGADSVPAANTPPDRLAAVGEGQGEKPWAGTETTVPAGLVQRQGWWVPTAIADYADWIANQKRKQWSLATELKNSVQACEAATGYSWYNDFVPEHQRSSLPWERQDTFRHLTDRLMTPVANAPLATPPHRRLLDTFGDSLKHVNKLYNKHFGYTARRVIAHMPHLLDVDIINDLAARFPEDWDRTSAHSLRHSHDMQYAFAYMYFMAHQEKFFNSTEQFTRLDTDGNGLLNVNELRTLVTRLYDIPTASKHWHEFESMLLNCSYLQPPMEELGVGVGSLGFF